MATSTSSRRLKANRVAINVEDGRTPLRNAKENSHRSIVKYLEQNERIYSNIPHKDSLIPPNNAQHKGHLNVSKPQKPTSGAINLPKRPKTGAEQPASTTCNSKSRANHADRAAKEAIVA
ncbi:hypothetical protein B7463_g4436, partial [Scytalidium lignicola]